MTARELELLGKVFDAEIMGTLPYQGGGKLAETLVERGMLEPESRTLPGRFPVRVSGFVLTHAGRMAWCESCGRIVPEAKA